MSQGVISSELMLFEPKAVNEGVEYLQYIECPPTNQITEDGSVDIHIKANGSQYLDLQRSRLHVKAKIVKEDGSNLEEADVVTPVNLWMQSLFNQVDVYFQQKLVSSSGTNYAYKAIWMCYSILVKMQKDLKCKPNCSTRIQLGHLTRLK